MTARIGSDEKHDNLARNITNDIDSCIDKSDSISTDGLIHSIDGGITRWFKRKCTRNKLEQKCEVVIFKALQM